jgi:hypothetical protein
MRARPNLTHAPTPQQMRNLVILNDFIGLQANESLTIPKLLGNPIIRCKGLPNGFQYNL